jgi:uncharacterized integral membrane protein
MRTWAARILLIVLLLTAILFGALNSTLVELDFLISKWNLPLGVALLAFFVSGAGVGLIAAYLAVVPRLRREIQVLKKSQQQKL